MSNLIMQIVSGVIVAALVYWLGLGKGNSTVYVKGVKSKKTGKWIIIISIIIIIWGLMLFGNQADLTGKANFNKTNGLMLFSVGVFLLIIGKIVAWFQRP